MNDISAFFNHCLFSEDAIEVSPDVTKRHERKAKPETWRRNVMKRLRAEGKEYVNAKGRVGNRVLGPDCHCRFKCFEKIPEPEKLLTTFNELADKQKQDTYLLSCISADQVHRRRSRSDVRQYSRKYSHTYHIYVSGSRIRICQKAFASLHGISKKRILLLATKRGQNGNQFFIPEENRGKHSNRVNRVPDEVHKNLSDHIASLLHRFEPNDISSDGSKEYLSPSLSIRQIYNLYLEKYEPTVLVESDKKPQVSYNYFLRFFKTNCNPQFEERKTKACETCERIEHELLQATTSSMKLKLMADKSMHLALVAAFSDDMKEKIQIAQKNKRVECLCFDFYQDLPLPKVPCLDAAHYRRLSVYIFCIYSITRNTAKFYIYDEVIGKRSANEVVSFLNHYIQTELPKGVKNLNIYSSSCVSQSENHTIMQYLSLLTQQHKSIVTVNHRFPQMGHISLPCHRAFDDIENNIKNTVTAYIPRHYADIITKTSKNFSVVNVDESMIKDYVHHLGDCFENFPESSVTNKCCTFQYSKETPDRVRASVPAVPEVYDEYVTSMAETYLEGNFALNTDKNAYVYPIPMNNMKYHDIQKLLAKYCPLEYLSYYAMIHPSATRQDCEYILPSDIEDEYD